VVDLISVGSQSDSDILNSFMQTCMAEHVAWDRYMHDAELSDDYADDRVRRGQRSKRQGCATNAAKRVHILRYVGCIVLSIN